MSSSLWPAERIAFALLATYLMHSTLLLGGAWLLLRLGRVRSDWLIERTWKLAAVAGLATSPLSLLWGISQPVYTFAGKYAAPKAAAVDAEGAGMLIVPAPGTQDWRLTTRSPGAPSAAYPGADEIPTAELFLAEPTAPSAATDAGKGPDVPAADVRRRTDFASWREVIVRPAVYSVAIIAIIGAVRLVVRTWRLERRLARETRSCNCRTAAIVARILRSADCRRRVRLIVSDTFGEAVACGVWRPTIVLPRDAEDLPRRELEAILAHLVRGDSHWLLIGRVLCGCLPIQPLNFIARREWRRAEDFLCDAWAVRHGARALSLAKRLTHAAEQQLPLRTLPAGLTFAGSRQTLSRRVERLIQREIGVDAWERPRRRRSLIVAAAIIFAAIGVWGPRGSASLAETGRPLPDRAAVEERIAADGVNGDEEQFAWRPAPDEATNLVGELRQLEHELHRAEALLRRLPPDAESAALVEILRRRMHHVRQRLSHVNN